jgi:3-oxoacyl-[acyl-carrier protein] reductase
VAFTYHASSDVAAEVAAATGALAVRADLAEPDAVSRLFGELDGRGFVADVLVHCAVVNCPEPFLEVTAAQWHRVLLVNGSAAFLACQAFAARLASGHAAHVVLVGALDRTQSLPIPVPFAASQGLIAALAMAAAKELGPRGIRVNMVALGPLEEGLSQELSPRLVADYRAFSSLRRLGTAGEAAQAILWLALENSYINGKVIPVNGGI